MCLDLMQKSWITMKCWMFERLLTKAVFEVLLSARPEAERKEKQKEKKKEKHFCLILLNLKCSMVK